MLKPRKSHTKSRYGCDNCRRRRVKCDEQGPPCTNCILRRLSNCTYSRVLPASLLANARRASETPATVNTGGTTSTTSTTSTASTGQQGQLGQINGVSHQYSHPPGVGGNAFNLNKIDPLELMHQFTAETYESLCVSESEIPTWQVMVPRLALKQRYLMNGILALASLHIATTRVSDDALAYIDAGLQYHSLSLEPFRIAIGNLTPENCNAAFAQSVVTTAISLALPQLTAKHENAVRMTDNILTVFGLLQGVKKILTIGQQQSWINLGLFSKGEFWRKDSFIQLDEETDAALNKLKDISGAHVNINVINHLRHCFMKFTCSSDPAPVLAWLAAVDKEFVESLHQRQPFSMLVLSYWGILLTELDGHRWWAKNAGRSLVRELMGSLTTEDPEWESCLAWVRQKLSRIPSSSVASSHR